MFLEARYRVLSFWVKNGDNTAESTDKGCDGWLETSYPTAQRYLYFYQNIRRKKSSHDPRKHFQNLESWACNRMYSANTGKIYFLSVKLNLGYWFFSGPTVNFAFCTLRWINFCCSFLSKLTRQFNVFIAKIVSDIEILLFDFFVHALFPWCG